MSTFFVPFADSPEQAERVYQIFIKNHGVGAPLGGRLREITFIHKGRAHVASVGSDITNFPETIGRVLGIVESPTLATVHTQLRGGLSATPVLVSPESIRQRLYFDDFPAPP